MLKFESNISEFVNKIDSNVRKTLPKLGKVGVKNINSNTPIGPTGNLKKANDYDIVDDTLYFTNDMDYAPFVEFGTFKMAAQPFMRTGIINSYTEFNSIIQDNLKT